MRRFVLLASAAAAAILSAGPAFASVTAIGGLGDPGSLVTGGTQLNFSNMGFGTKTTASEQGITFTAETGKVFVIDGQYGENYNKSGHSLHGNFDGTEFQSLEITFTTAVQAFAFNWGAADTGWLLEAFNGAVSVGLVDVPLIPAATPNLGNFYGIASSSTNITRAVLYVDGAHYNPRADRPDYVFMDNFTTGFFPVSAAPEGGGTTVPEPSVWAMLIMGFGLAGGSLRRRNGLARA
jgi:hypothetical protein